MNSKVVVFPPVIPAAGFVAGVVLGRLAPLALPTSVERVMHFAGPVVFALGVAGFAWMVRTMKRAKTPIHNGLTPTALVETGPFARTRNPMYLFGSIAYAGLALAFVQAWSLALLPVVLVVTHYGVVLREERGLEQLFGADYLRYKAKVPRWV